MFWRRPLLWIAVGWASGMTIASGLPVHWVAFGGVAAGIAAIAWHGLDRRGLIAAVVLSASVTIGGGWFEWHEEKSVSRIPLAGDAEAEATLRGVIVSPPEADGDRVVFDIEAWEAIIDGETSILPGERMKVYIRLDEEEEHRKAAEWKRGDQAAVTGQLKRPLPATNFGGFDYRLYLRRQYMFWTVQAVGTVSVEHSEPERWTLPRALSYVDRVRHHLGERIEALFPSPVSGFMKGLLLGVKGDMDPEQYRAFSQIGLTHILAISGLHVAIFVGSILWLLGKLPMTRETRFLIAIAAIPVYILITGASPSVLRAGLMAMIALYAARRGLLKDGLHILAAAVLLMLVWNPFYLYNISFQLSFAVTAGLMIWVPLVNEGLRWIKYVKLRSAVSVTLVAQLVSFPLTITYFNGFSLLSFPANLVMVPVFSLGVLPLGSIALLLSYVLPPVAPFAAIGTEWLTAVSFHTIAWLNGFEAASTIWATPPVWWLPAYFIILYVGAAAGAGRIRLPVSRRYVVIPCTFLLAGLFVFAYDPDFRDRAAVISIIDVGQGDAILIRTPSGNHALIDGGGTLRFSKPGEEWRLRTDPFEVGKDVVVPLLKRRGVQSIDALFLSHGDTDHIGGLQAVLEHIPVRRLFFNGTVKPSGISEMLLRAALHKRIPLTPAYEGMSIHLDPATKVLMLYPKTSSELTVEEKQNGVSLVFLLTVYDRTFLFAGDIGAAEERAILAAMGESVGTDAAAALTVDVLKVAHHGSKSSTTQEWLEAWQPKVAVISAGRTNVYGHPHHTVTERLQENGIKTYRTDMQGEIQFRVTRDSFQVRARHGEE